MAKTKQQKAEVIAKLEKALKQGSSTVFVGFTKIDVADETALRRGMREEGVTYMVAKKTLIRRALTSLGLAHEDMPLEGEVAVAYSTADGDAVAPARLAHGFSKKVKGTISILGGIFEGKLMGQEAMLGIATIPSMDVLRGMFANIINSPRQRFAIALSEVAKTKN